MPGPNRMNPNKGEPKQVQARGLVLLFEFAWLQKYPGFFLDSKLIIMEEYKLNPQNPHILVFSAFVLGNRCEIGSLRWAEFKVVVFWVVCSEEVFMQHGVFQGRYIFH